ncbi:MAG: protein-L-isoaspartate(D-aspartate) O-methyltransferase [Spirochaetales bacterium]|nr:protein-L-isoaspartate(D-aspartate) O-methyltransferase [Spirochaetales bacterium]
MDRALEEFFHVLDRAQFIDNKCKSFAALDTALPIGFGQTISQPSLVLYMTDALQLDTHCSVLEIGTGSGYQTAFLAQFAAKVYTIERIRELGETAKTRLDALGYRNIEYKIGDGSTGWQDYAPFDRIIVTAAPRVIPEDLIEQLAPNGYMILPVGPPGLQQLLLIHRDSEHSLHQRCLLDVAFVEMKGKYS